MIRTTTTLGVFLTTALLLAPAGSGLAQKNKPAEPKPVAATSGTQAAEAEAEQPSGDMPPEGAPASAVPEATATDLPPTSAPAPVAESPGGPSPSTETGETQQKFFTDEPQQFRFLEKDQRAFYTDESRQAPNPTGPPADIPVEEPRRRGDAGAPIAIAIAVEQDWNLDSGYDLFGEDDVSPRADLWFSYDLVSLTTRLILAGEVGAGTGVENSTGLFNGLETSLKRTVLYAGVNLRYVLVPCLQPHLRLSGGYSVIEAQFDLDGDDHFEDRDAAPIGSVGAGFTLRTPTRLFENRQGDFASLSLGIMFEGGYGFSGPASFALDAENGDRIEVREAELGELALSGPYFRTSLVVRF